jgi:hypothetical protein
MGKLHTAEEYYDARRFTYSHFHILCSYVVYSIDATFQLSKLVCKIWVSLPTCPNNAHTLQLHARTKRLARS